ncbi:hypothetical protein PSQ90_02745 [Devosia rhodophyticola]|uniref:Uncharacterized protein n=1 Tax=Devosia rhodophyticola TaxID=3026423 RepID=A0ABY7YYG1_9HYPH|nr:hypothetical protein [Devosia rhodophyticola]WDR06404.1 hypothetical protein PSQ90_02745 [Devosia rhodophyticola]
MAEKSGQNSAQQTFRQFAWHLAGTLASAKGTGKPAKAGGGKR